MKKSMIDNLNKIILINSLNSANMLMDSISKEIDLIDKQINRLIHSKLLSNQILFDDKIKILEERKETLYKQIEKELSDIDNY